MALQFYINFNGNCSEVVDFYSEVFNAPKQQIMRYGDMPADSGFPMTDEVKNMVMHTFLVINGNTVMFSDVPPGMPFTAGNNISIMYGSDDVEEIKSIFAKIKIDGTVNMDLQETFWSKCYGFVVDKFGIGWQFSLEK